MPTRLRRLTFEEPRGGSRRVGGDERFRSNRVHPFRYIHEPRSGHKMRVCLDASALDDGSPDSEIALRLLSELQPAHYEVFRTPGAADEPVAAIPAFAIGDESDVAQVRLVAFGHERGTGVFYPSQWEDLAEYWVGDRAAAAEIVAVRAAESLDAHVFITKSPALLRIREVHRFKSPVVTPLEALPILWTWSRGFGDYWDGHIVTSANNYYWALARAVTPNANPGFAALVHAEYRRGDGHELVALAQSVLARLASASHNLDTMYLAWQLPTNNDTIDTICEKFDQIVLSVSAILDNLALLVGRYLGVTGLRPHEWSLVHARYLQKLRGVTDPRALRVIDYVDANRARLTFHTELRHHAVHRERLPGILFRNERDPEEARIRVFEPMLGTIWSRLEAAGQDPTEWGFSHRQGPHDTPVSFVGQPDRKETIHSPGEALLDPMSFGPRLVRLTARVVDDLFGQVRFQDDASISQEERAIISSSEGGARWPFRATDRRTLILTSPMSGL